MENSFEPTKVLITVMTYPHPSKSHMELVCTAGITENLEWVRLYPINFRYQPREHQFRKYQWIQVDLESRGAGNDSRKESRKPKLESIEIVGERLSSKNSWKERKAIIDQMPHCTLNKLKELYEVDKTSLGIVKPTKIHEVKVEPADSEWKPEWQQLFGQLKLFGPQQKPLAKIPYKFSYVFECEDSEKPHNAMIEDWELGVLFLHERDRLGSDEAAAESVRKKFFDEMCGPEKDTRFFVGTVFPYNTWVVLGVFWPPLDKSQTEGNLEQLRLF